MQIDMRTPINGQAEKISLMFARFLDLRRSFSWDKILLKEDADKIPSFFYFTLWCRSAPSHLLLRSRYKVFTEAKGELDGGSTYVITLLLVLPRYRRYAYLAKQTPYPFRALRVIATRDEGKRAQAIKVLVPWW